MRPSVFALILGAGVTAAVVSGCNKSSQQPPMVPVPPSNSNSAFINIPKSDAYYGNSNFSPQSVTINVGGSVTWINNDTQAHNPTQNDNAWSGELASGAQVSHTFPTAGNFPFHCSLHPEMTGSVTVKVASNEK